MKVGDLVSYPGTVAYGRGVGIVVEMEDVSCRIRILTHATKSGYVVHLERNLEVISESR